MIERIRSVRNPLTVIAIFAGLAEIAGTVGLATVDKELQPTFIWFVMSFPILIVLCFFLTLNFNPSVLYGPSDFKHEENWLSVQIGSKRVTTKQSLTRVISQLTAADLPKIREIIRGLDPDAQIGATLDAAKAQLQTYVRGARTPTRIAILEVAFVDAGLPVH